MSLLSSLFRSKKVNLTPDIPQPTQDQLEFTAPLRTLAKQRINGAITGENVPGTGFGDDFVEKSSNPIAAQMRRNFLNQTSPFLSSEASKRGLGRSTIALDQQLKGQQNVESDIGALMAKFYTLNEQQKKNDINAGVDLGHQLNTEQYGIMKNQADASERLANATAGDARTREANDRQLAGNALQAGAQLTVPALGGFSTIANSAGFEGLGELLSKAQGGMSAFNNGGRTSTTANILGSDDREKLIQLLLGS